MKTFRIPTEIGAALSSDSEQCIEITFDRVVVFSYDPHYGADADGRRGIPMTFIDEDYAENILVKVAYGTLKAVSLAEWPEPLRVQAAIDAYMELNPPTAPEEPEFDFDDRSDDE
jgi:hypothetical protein